MFGLTANPATQVSGGIQCRIWMSHPYNAKMPPAYHVKSITRYTGGLSFFLSSSPTLFFTQTHQYLAQTSIQPYNGHPRLWFAEANAQPASHQTRLARCSAALWNPAIPWYRLMLPCIPNTQKVLFFQSLISRQLLFHQLLYTFFHSVGLHCERQSRQPLPFPIDRGIYKSRLLCHFYSLECAARRCSLLFVHPDVLPSVQEYTMAAGRLQQNLVQFLWQNWCLCLSVVE